MSNRRRYYFDDGSSRKRWHVQVTGKTQIVEYGRLGASLREAKKSFKSPAEANEQTEKLIAKKKREGYIEIDPSRLEIVPLKGKKKATEKQILALEKQIGCTLPDEYRDFLKSHNGGRPNPDCVPVPGMKGIDNVGVGVLFHLQPTQPAMNELTHEFERAATLLPAGHLPIAGNSDIYTLSLKPKTFGAVYWWFHETEELDDDGNFLEAAEYLLAGSFDEFLTRIALLFGDDQEVEMNPTAKPGSEKKKSKATIKQLFRLVNHDHTPEKVKGIEQLVKELGDLSGISDGEWPFINLHSSRLLGCLLKAGLSPEILDKEQQSLLWQCATSPECVDLLLQRGADINRRSGEDGETALMRAIFLQNIPAVEHLLKAGANPTLRPPSHINRPLAYNEKLKKTLEKAKAKWSKAQGKKKPSTPLQVKPKTPLTTRKKRQAAPSPRKLLRLMKHDYFPEWEEIDEIVEAIAELGDLSNIQDGEWPKIDKIENPRLLRCLLEAGLNPEITDKEGNTLLCQCATHEECVDLLLKQGVEVNRRSGRDKQTALMRATSAGDEDCVKRLLKAGANPTLEFTPFAKVMLDMDEEMTELIEAARKKWNRKKPNSTKKATARKK